MSIFDNEGKLLIALSRQLLDRTSEDTARMLLADGTASIDWPHFLDQAIQHRVAPLVSSSLDRLAAEDRPLRVDRGMGSTLRAFYLFHLERNRAAMAELYEILDAAEVASLDIVLRKGAHLAQEVYMNSGLRPIGDLDLLVPGEQASTLVALLEDRGYQQGVLEGREVRRLSRREALFWRLYGSDVPKLNKLTDNPYLPVIDIDVNISLVLPGKSGEVPVSDLMERSVVREVGGRPQRFLSPVDCALDLCLHIYKNSTALRFMNLRKHRRLLKYVDVVEYLRTRGGKFPWGNFVERAREYCIVLPVFYALAHVELLFPGEIPPEVLTEFGRSCADVDTFLNQYGQWDGPEPLIWTRPFGQRFFSRQADEAIPHSKSLV
ncbi:nucleotidyltransferase domain-containing protein [Streptomyces silvisoli]|uniref:Nucleotidyltransferase family protein n=1 Tax=Streptomyces silvisoli TaxID=3034235 RepID=A0ABT5ZKS4_9ACTN|nr:nucleotidyltransferase family protein [Streptomyces silvisoli]MDF3290291.1 nucleotidyltransferase family protein [Streptomyces silvisoli]